MPPCLLRDILSSVQDLRFIKVEYSHYKQLEGKLLKKTLERKDKFSTFKQTLVDYINKNTPENVKCSEDTVIILIKSKSNASFLGEIHEHSFQNVIQRLTVSSGNFVTVTVV